MNTVRGVLPNSKGKLSFWRTIKTLAFRTPCCKNNYKLSALQTLTFNVRCLKLPSRRQPVGFWRYHSKEACFPRPGSTLKLAADPWAVTAAFTAPEAGLPKQSIFFVSEAPQLWTDIKGLKTGQCELRGLVELVCSEAAWDSDMLFWTFL